jgi:hypothetical protein
MSMFSNKEKADEVRREITYREWVYGRLVADGRMHLAEKQRRIGIMKDILSDYERLDSLDRPDLFGGKDDGKG